MSDYFLDYVRANQRLNYAAKNQNKVGNEENEPTTLAYPSDDAAGGTPTAEKENSNNELSDVEINSIKQEIAELLNDVLEALFNFFKEDNKNVSDNAETKAYPSDDGAGAMPPSADNENKIPDRPSYETDDKKPATKAFPSDDAVGTMPPSFGGFGNSGIATMAYPSDDAIGGMP